jgi:hypothetical protein
VFNDDDSMCEDDDGRKGDKVDEEDGGPAVVAEAACMT